MEKTNIYFIGSIKLGAVKIGSSQDPENRLKQLQTGQHEKLTLFGVLKDVEQEREKYVQSYFDVMGTRLEGEWYVLDDLMIYQIFSYLKEDMYRYIEEEFDINFQEIRKSKKNNLSEFF
jgi:hypothetical protein